MAPNVTSLKDSMKRLQKNSGVLMECNENDASPELPSRRKSPRLTDKENLKTPKSLMRKSTGGNKKRVSFGDTLSPEYFDKRLPPIIPVRLGQSPMGTPKEKDRRQSDPLRQQALLSSASSKRLSIGTMLSTMPIAEEDMDESQHDAPPLLDFDLTSTVQDVFEDSPNTKLKLPSPLKAEVVASTSKDGTPVNTEETMHCRRRKLATPLRNQLQRGVQLRTKKKLDTPLREDIKKGKKILRPRRSSISTSNRKSSMGTKRRKLQTPLRKEIEEKKSLEPTKKELPTPKLPSPLREDISKGTQLKETKKRVLKTPLKRDILAKPTLRKTLKTGLKTPIRQQIKKGNLLNLYIV